MGNDGQTAELAADGARCKAECKKPQGCNASQRFAGTADVALSVCASSVVDLSTCMGSVGSVCGP